MIIENQRHNNNKPRRGEIFKRPRIYVTPAGFERMRNYAGYNLASPSGFGENAFRWNTHVVAMDFNPVDM